MNKQNYKNYKRYYPPHHFVFLPLLGILLIIGIKKSFTEDENNLVWILFSVSIFCILYLAIMIRQHYALGNQDRIVKLEFKLRYFELYGIKSDEVEKKLSFDQIASLRFTVDSEFKILLEKTLKENLSGEEIRKAIHSWKPDNERV